MVAVSRGKPSSGDLGQHSGRGRRGMRTLFRLLWIALRKEKIAHDVEVYLAYPAVRMYDFSSLTTRSVQSNKPERFKICKRLSFSSGSL